MFFSRNIFLFAITLSATSYMVASVNTDDDLADIDHYRATTARPPFHDDAEMLNMVLESSLRASILIPANSIVPCETLTIDELDERLIFMESLKSKGLDAMYDSEDYRKNPYNSIYDLQSKINGVNNNSNSIFTVTE